MQTAEQRDQAWMQHALALADKAEQQGEIPVGAVLVETQTNRILGEGWNQSIQLNDPSAHAEMLAVRQAGQRISNYRLINTTLYVTLEPCPMCAGLLVHSRVERLVFGAYDQKTGAAGSLFNLLDDERLNHKVHITAGVMQEACSARLSAFFKRRRVEQKASRKRDQIPE